VAPRSEDPKLVIRVINFELVQPICSAYLKRNFFHIHYDQKNTLIPLVKSVFKSVHNHGRYLKFCERHVCSIQYAATRRLQLCAWPILCTGLRPAQLFLVKLTFGTFITFICHIFLIQISSILSVNRFCFPFINIYVICLL